MFNTGKCTSADSETCQLLETRVKEHLSRNSCAVHEHCQLTGNSEDSTKAQVLATETNTFKLRRSEAIEIDHVSSLWTETMGSNCSASMTLF